MKIYLDNAATTPLDPAVLDAMTPYLLEHFGNPSSQHQYGRKARSVIENCRSSIAVHLNCLPEEIIFTSGGTEADNIALVSAVTLGGVDHVITTPFEHHAVLQTLKSLAKSHDVRTSFLQHDNRGNLDPDHLHYLLRTNTRNLVSVMHANNEIGNLNDIAQIAESARHFKALFHTDTVQTMGHYHYNLATLPAHFLAASAHKFHGPKGVGFLYCRKGTPLARLIHGGGQERALRAGTENIPGIVGLATALDLAYQNLVKDHLYIQSLKDRLIRQLRSLLPEVQFNGNSALAEQSLYTVLSVNFPNQQPDLLRALDEQGIAVSGGSACSTGAASHVLKAIGVTNGNTIRFSFSRFNTPEQIDRAAFVLAGICELVAA